MGASKQQLIAMAVALSMCVVIGLSGCGDAKKTGEAQSGHSGLDDVTAESPADPQITAESPTDPQIPAESPADPNTIAESPVGLDTTAESPADPKITAESIGLDPSAKSLGPDANGLYWFKTPGRGPDGQPLPDKFDHWTYKPKTDTLYQATRGDDGQWKMVERPAVTAESLKLGPGAKYAGKDPLGRYWFKRSGRSARVVYDPKSKKLFRAVQQDDGEWKLTEISSTQP